MPRFSQPGDTLAGRIETDARRLLMQRRPADAVSLALRHGLLDLAAELLACGSADLVRGMGDYEIFFHVIDALGADRVRRWPELDAAAVWALTFSNRLRLATVRLDELEARIPDLIAEGRSFAVDLLATPFDRIDPRTGMQCWAGMMRTMIAAFAGEGERALHLADQWRASFPRAPEYEVATVHCASMLGFALTGRLATAERHGLMALTIFRKQRIEYGIAWSASGVACTLIGQGRIDQARSIVEDASRHVGSRLLRPTHAELPLRLVECAILFESGDFEALKQQPETRLDEYPGPLHTLIKVRVSVRLLLALGQTADAMVSAETARFEGSAVARAWWDHEIAIEQAFVAAVAGETGKRTYLGPASARGVLKLITDSIRSPSAALLGPLRARLQQAQERDDSDMMMLFGFLKARVEHGTGNRLQARRSIHAMLVGPGTRERVGTLASMANALQPMFGEVLGGLLRDPAGTTPELRQLAALVGVGAAPAAPATPCVTLSKREHQASAALLEGLSNREIAERLHVKEQTVKWHLWNLFQKLGVRNRGSAVRVLTQLGIVDVA